MSPPISPPKNGSRNQKINKVDLLLCVKHTTRHRSPPDASLDLVTIDLALNYTRIRLDEIKNTKTLIGGVLISWLMVRERRRDFW